MEKRFELNNGWRFCLAAKNKNSGDIPETIKYNRWFPATVPGTVHTDLLANGLIDDPFFADNELRLQWIHRQDWRYALDFDLPDTFDHRQRTWLEFDGLDTIGTIFLNGSEIGSAENMFRQYRFDISAQLKPAANRLEILFHSPLVYGEQMNERFGKLQSARHDLRAHIRKAQYSFGWDWGPEYPTVGIWRAVRLVQNRRMRVNGVYFDTLEILPEKTRLRVRLDYELFSGLPAEIVLTMNNDGNEVEWLIEPGETEFEFFIADPELWWPHGSGAQNLYRLQVSFFDSDKSLLARVTKKVGIRTVELQQKDEHGEAFRFIVNGKAIFMKGANWIPSDAFLPRVSNRTYRQLLQKACDANMNMLRVWGGGIYEQDIFYDLCDELGLLVWQDFMFACSSYPEHEAFIENVEHEVKDNMARLQSHPCIAIWCGNNENEWIWSRSGHGGYTNMPGYGIFHEKLPQWVAEIDPPRPYWPSSPFGKGEDPNGTKSGNRHAWHIWSGWVDYDEVVGDDSLFVTEFGFQAPANRDTFESVLEERQRGIQDEIFEFHNKQTEGPERLLRFLSAHLPVRTEWDKYIYLTQLNQGFALQTCLQHWRSRWPQTAGGIIWQLNDCWPVSGWALVDSRLKTKLSWHFVRRAFADYALFFKGEGSSLQIGVHSPEIDTEPLRLEMQWICASGGEIFHTDSCVYAANGQPVKAPINPEPEITDAILLVTLKSKTGEILARNARPSKPWKYMKFPAPGLTADLISEKQLQLSTAKPAWFVDLYMPGVDFSDRGFILLPGERKLIDAIPLSKIEVSESFRLKYYCLNEI